MKAKRSITAESVQPALFSPEQLPDVPALVEAAKQFLHTGKIVCKDGERAERIALTYLQTRSLRATSRALQCHPRTVNAVLEVYEAAGKLDALKQRLSSRMGLILELSIDDTLDRVVSGKQKLTPIEQAVFVDKKLLLDGDATSISVQRHQVDVNVQDVLGYLQSKGIAAPAIDVESTVSPGKPKETLP